jgi:hypothetical protein
LSKPSDASRASLSRLRAPFQATWVGAFPSTGVGQACRSARL